MFANESRRIRAYLLLKYGETFTSAYITTNGFGIKPSLYNGKKDGMRFTTCDGIALGNGLTVIDSDENKLRSDWDTGILSDAADSVGNVSFYVTLEFSTIPVKQIQIYLNTAYSPVVEGTIKAYQGTTELYSGSISGYTPFVTFQNELMINKIRIDVTKAQVNRRVNIVEVNTYSGFSCDESRISSIQVTENICGNKLGTIAKKSVVVIIRNEDNLFNEGYIPQFARPDANVELSIYDQDESIVYSKLNPTAFEAQKNKIAKLIATDTINQFKNNIYLTVPDNSSLSSILNAIADYYDIDIVYPQRFSTITIPIPIVGKTGYDTLKNIALATATFCYADRDGKIIFSDIGTSNNQYSVSSRYVFDSKKVQKDTFLYNSIDVSVYEFAVQAESQILSTSVAISGTTTLTFDFNGAYKSPRVEVINATLIDSKLGNYGAQITIQGIGTASITFYGRKIEMASNKTIHAQSDSSIEIYGRKTFEVRSNYVQSVDYAQSLANMILNLFANRALTMIARTSHPYNFRLNDKFMYYPFSGVITKLDISLNRGLSSQVEVIQDV